MLRCSCSTAASYLGIGTLQFSGSLRVNYALHPSKSGLINKHTVKHTVKCSQVLVTSQERSAVVWCLYFDANIMQWLRIGVWRPFVGLCGDNISFLVPCARISPD